MLALGACMRLDPFLYDPALAEASTDLMARATDIPIDLKTELNGDIVAADGTVVDAWLLSHRANDGTPATRHETGILYCHGNAQNIDLFSLRVEALWKQGYTVLIFDYRGFGKTLGTPTEQGLYQDARAARTYLGNRADLGMQPSRLVLYGYSLGAAICSELAVESPTPALLIEAPFASVRELIEDNADMNQPRGWYADTAYDTRGKISKHRGALFVLHGTNDTYVTPRYGQEVSAAAAGHALPNLLWLVQDADHVTVPCATVSQRSPIRGGCIGGTGSDYLNRVTDFIDTALR